MKTPRDLYGTGLAKRLCKHWGYRQSHFTGSHILLGTDTVAKKGIDSGAPPVAVGTLNFILNDAAAHKGVTREDILRGL